VDGVGDLAAAVAGGDAVQAGAPVDQRLPTVILEVDPVRLDEESGLLLEVLVGSERHPEFFE
jgi:hypothetical protein